MWSGPAVPDGVEAEYPVELNLPPGAGTTLYFPTIQRCGPDDRVRWIEIPAEGQDPEELAEPAPAVLAGGQPGRNHIHLERGHDDHEATTTTAETATTAEATTTTAEITTTAAPDTTAPATTSTASVTTTTPSPSTTVAESEGGGTLPVALAVGGAAVVAVGAYALARSRNKQ